MIVTTRFAPAPTGYLHLGHIRNALYVWDFARVHGGHVVLRIEDHDRQRCRPEYEAAIHEDLAWLGFVPDITVPRQSERGGVYQDVLNGLIARGLVYACDCPRSALASPRYPGTCRRRALPLIDGYGWRVRLEHETIDFVDLMRGPQTQTPSAQCGDVLVRDREDGRPVDGRHLRLWIPPQDRDAEDAMSRGEIEHASPHAEPDARRLDVGREHAEPHTSGHGGDTPRASNSSLDSPPESTSTAPHENSTSVAAP